MLNKFLYRGGDVPGKFNLTGSYSRDFTVDLMSGPEKNSLFCFPEGSDPNVPKIIS